MREKISGSGISVRISGQSFLVRKGNEKSRVQYDHGRFDFIQNIWFSLFMAIKKYVPKEPIWALCCKLQQNISVIQSVGQSVLLTGGSLNYHNGCIMKDILENFHKLRQTWQQFSVSAATQTHTRSVDSQWARSFNLASYLLLKKKNQVVLNPLKTFSSKINLHFDFHTGKQLKMPRWVLHFFLNLRDVHSQPQTRRQQSATYIMYISFLIAVFILLIAPYKFYHLTTARSAERAKEVGIRKVLVLVSTGEAVYGREYCYLSAFP